MDNPALHVASTASKMLPLYVFDKQDYQRRSPYGFQRIGPHRAVFVKESVIALRNRLREGRSDLIVRFGGLEEELVEGVRKVGEVVAKGNEGLGEGEGEERGRVVVVGTRETGWEERVWERKVERVVEREGGVVVWVEGGRLCWIKEGWLGFRSGKGIVRAFTEYRKVVEAKAVLEDPLEVPELPPVPRVGGFAPVLEGLQELPLMGEDLGVQGMCEPHDHPFPDSRAVMPFLGGVEEAEDRVDDWMWKLDMLKRYKELRNFSGDREVSSKLSPWLVHGCISPRTVLSEIKKYEQKRTKNESTYWLVFELITRDYFKWLADHAGASLFAWNGFTRPNKPQFDLPRHTNVTDIDRDRLEAWINGMTGSPFVDAAMREMKATGYMSNRCRQNVASFLINDLKFPDWRAGAEYFESALIDYDVAANWGNWAYIAGKGSDPRGGRKFNIIKQARDYDPDAKFVKKWCPELWKIPYPATFEPYSLSKEDLKEYDVELGKTYPQPIVKLDGWLRKKPARSNGKRKEQKSRK